MHDKKENVLYLTHDGLTDPLGQSQILPYLSGLSDKFSITIISFEKPLNYDRLSNHIHSFCQKNKLTWIPLTYHNRPPLLSTIVDIWRMYDKAVSLHKGKGFSIVHCRSYVTSLVGLRLKKKYDIPFIFDMRGFWADERKEGGIWNTNNFIYKRVYDFFKQKEKEFVAAADQVVVLTEAARNFITEKWNVPDNHITVIPCCVDLNHFNPDRIAKEDVKQLRKSLSIEENDFVLLYLGSWGTWYLTAQMLTFFQEMKKHVPSAHFLIVSQDNIKIENKELEQFVTIRSASREQVPLFIASANASVFFIKDSFSKKGSSATKMAEIMAMNLPVVTNRGWGDISALEKKITGLLTVENESEYTNSIEQLQRPYSGIRESIQKEFDLSVGVGRYKKVYEWCISHSK